MTGPCSNARRTTSCRDEAGAAAPGQRASTKVAGAKAVDQVWPSSPATGASSAACGRAPLGGSDATVSWSAGRQSELLAAASASGGCRIPGRLSSRHRARARRRRRAACPSSWAVVRAIASTPTSARTLTPKRAAAIAEYVTPPPSFQPRGSSGAMSRVAAPNDDEGRPELGRTYTRIRHYATEKPCTSTSCPSRTTRSLPTFCSPTTAEYDESRVPGDW